jgi:hypothetical protein
MGALCSAEEGRVSGGTEWDGLATSTRTRVVGRRRQLASPQSDHTRRPRILISTPVVDFKLYALDEWVGSIRGQVCDLDFDVLWHENTDRPRPGYLEWLTGFARTGPFGRGHRFRITRFGQSVDGQRFAHPHSKIAVAHQRGWECAQARVDSRRARDRYDAILFWECDVIAPPTALQVLWDSGFDWAAAWMTTRPMIDQRNHSKGLEIKELPLLWHGLTRETWMAARGWDDIIPLGWAEQPSIEPFPCTVTHLGLTLVRSEVVRRVPFTLTTAGADVSQSWAAAEAGYQPMCVPAVRCTHKADWEASAWRNGAPKPSR